LLPPRDPHLSSVVRTETAAAAETLRRPDRIATEEDLKAAGDGLEGGEAPLQRQCARADNDSEGFAKILSDATTDRLLGAHIIGPPAGLMIAERALAIELGASAEDVGRTGHAIRR